MSLFGAMNTAISGLNAQAAAFTNISDNVANSQTVGYKGVGTSFQDYLTTSNATTNSSGSVVAKPEYQNNIQGTVAQSNNPLALAISGQGFFPISMPTGGTAGSAPFSLLHPRRRLPVGQERLCHQQRWGISQRLESRSGHW